MHGCKLKCQERVVCKWRRRRKSKIFTIQDWVKTGRKTDARWLTEKVLPVQHLLVVALCTYILLCHLPGAEDRGEGGAAPLPRASGTPLRLRDRAGFDLGAGGGSRKGQPTKASHGVRFGLFLDALKSL